MAINNLAKWRDLGRAAMQALDVEMAIRCYTHIGDAGMVLALEQIRGVEDRSLLSGYVAMFLEDFNTAQDLFLASSYPQAALEVSCFTKQNTFFLYHLCQNTVVTIKHTPL